MDLFKDLHAQGRTIIMVTHEKNIAEQCGRRIFMKDGRITESNGRGA
jgi:ABC-type lipoprotein export system ATPase subunit